MIKRTWAAAALVAALSLAVAAAYFTKDPAPPPTTQTQIAQAPEQPLPELVADLIRSGSPECPGVGSLRYEACLLYQGALGIWRNVGFGEACKSAKPVVRPTSEIVPEDALNAPKSSCFRSIFAVLVANHTPILSSTALRVFYMTGTTGFKEPGSDADVCIQVRHGICGNQAAVGLAFFKMANIEARTVKFFYGDDKLRLSHIIVEAMINGKWRLIDTTYGSYWSSDSTGRASFSIAATDDVLRDEKVRSRAIYNHALIPYSVYETMIDVDRFNYLKGDADVIRGDAGTIDIDMIGDRGIEDFSSIPNYVGDIVPNRPFSGVEYDLKPQEKVKPIDLTIDVSGAAISGDKPVWMCIDAECQALDTGVKQITFHVTNPDRLYIKTENDVSYVVMKSIRWQVADIQQPKE